MPILENEPSMEDMEDVNSAVNRSSMSYEEFHDLATKLESMETMLKSNDTKLDHVDAKLGIINPAFHLQI
ncbi:hypothetical protein AAC387_Pa01g4082 [Persea americana]